MPDFIKIPEKSKLYQAKKDSHVEVLVGGINVDHFAPSANFSYKMDSGIEQYFFNICDDETQVDTVGKEEEWNGSDKIKVKDKDESTFLISENALKIERVFYQKPTVAPKYKLAFSYGVQFFCQAALTIEEMLEGQDRPDNVVGSYAVYCDKQGHIKNADGSTKSNYGCGKIGHLYAPYWTDSSGKKIKGTQEIIGNILTYALPSQEWIDSSVLPITLDPDIGYTSIGASTFFNEEDRVYAFKATSNPAANGILDSVSLYLGTTNNENSGRVAIYDDNSGYPGDLVYGGPEISLGDGSGGWKTYTVSGTTNIVSGTQYWNSLWWTDDIGTTLQMRYDSAPANSYYRYDKTYSTLGAWDDPYAAGASSFAFLYSMYFTYTESGLLPINLTDTISLSDSFSKTIFKNLSDTITLSDSLFKVVDKNISDFVTLSDNISKSVNIQLLDTVNLSDNIFTLISLILNLADTITLSDSISKTPVLNKSDTVNLSDEISKLVNLNKSDLLNLSDYISKEIGVSLSDTITLTDDFNALMSLILNLSDTITLTDTISKNISLNKEDSVTLSDEISKTLGLTMADVINLSDQFSTDMDVIIALLNFVAKNRTFNFNAKSRGL